MPSYSPPSQHRSRSPRTGRGGGSAHIIRIPAHHANRICWARTQTERWESTHESGDYGGAGLPRAEARTDAARAGNADRRVRRAGADRRADPLRRRRARAAAGGPGRRAHFAGRGRCVRRGDDTRPRRGRLALGLPLRLGGERRRRAGLRPGAQRQPHRRPQRARGLPRGAGAAAPRLHQQHRGLWRQRPAGNHLRYDQDHAAGGRTG